MTKIKYSELIAVFIDLPTRYISSEIIDRKKKLNVSWREQVFFSLNLLLAKHKIRMHTLYLVIVLAIINCEVYVNVVYKIHK
jgi:hypothetical protein